VGRIITMVRLRQFASCSTGILAGLSLILLVVQIVILFNKNTVQQRNNVRPEGDYTPTNQPPTKDPFQLLPDTALANDSELMHSLGKDSPESGTLQVNSLRYNRDVNFLRALTFLPPSDVPCEDLFGYIEHNHTSQLLSRDLLDELKVFDYHLARVVRRLKVTEDFERQSLVFGKKQVVWTMLIYQEFARTVCETGFNTGHSTLTYLVTNPGVQVHSFDLGQHAYSREMARYINQRFPGRYTYICIGLQEVKFCIRL